MMRIRKRSKLVGGVHNVTVSCKLDSICIEIISDSVQSYLCICVCFHCETAKIYANINVCQISLMIFNDRNEKQSKYATTKERKSKRYPRTTLGYR